MIFNSKKTVRSVFFSPLYSSLALSGKLADLGCLHSLSQAGVCPAVAGGGSVGLVGSNRKVQTSLGSSGEVGAELRAHHHLGHVGLRPAGGVTGRPDVSLTGSQAGGQIGQRGSSCNSESSSSVRRPALRFLLRHCTVIAGHHLKASKFFAFLCVFKA